jgi:nicotinamide-nucleotide amidase
MTDATREITRRITARAEALAATLTARGARVATAESCTGGWLAKCLTDLPGSSAWFEYGIVAYGNNAKRDLLGVCTETLDAHGAVSQDVAEQMATGVRLAAASELAVAITGIAGPGGGSPDKPVGTVWMAWAGPGSRLESRVFRFEGDRAAVRAQAVLAALEGLLERLGEAS